MQDPIPKAVSLRPSDFSISIGIDKRHVLTFDMTGRPLTCFLDERTYKRGLDNRVLLVRRDRMRGRELKERRLLELWETMDLLRRIHSIMTAVEEKFRTGEAEIFQPMDGRPFPTDRIGDWLKQILSMDPPTLAKDRDRFLSVYKPVGILPPDQYLSVVLQGTEGCSHNRCTFCHFYREIEFRIKSLDEFARHIRQVKEFLGPAIGLRRAIFLADANAMIIPQKKLIPLMERIREEFPIDRDGDGLLRLPSGEEIPHRFAGIHSFIDSFSGPMKEAKDFLDLEALSLRRIYLGLESGNDRLLRFLEKPGTSREALALVRRVKKARISVGVIVMAGIGGKKFAKAHIEDTVALLKAMELGRRDILYISDFHVHPDSEYRRRSESEGIEDLDLDGIVGQRRTLADALLPMARKEGFKIAPYSIQNFIY